MSHSLLHSPQFFQDRHLDSIRMKAMQFRARDLQSTDRARIRRNELVLKLLKKILKTDEAQQSEEIKA